MNVLVLNQDYSPLMICTVQRAFLLIYLKKAELVSSIDQKELRTVSRSYPYPSIIRIGHYAHVPYRGVVLTRHNVMRRDDYQCQYCGNKTNLTLDHLIPRSKGGKTTWTNLVTACSPCNAKKSDYTLEQMGFQLKNKPVKPSYLMFLKGQKKNMNTDWYNYLEPKAY